MTAKTTKMDIAISTCDRDPQYVHGTLESMFSTDVAAQERSVRLVVSGESDEYLEPWLRHTNIATQVVAPSEQHTLDCKPTHRTTYNFMRVLEGEGPLVALQDDVIFARDWLVRADDLLAAAMHRYGDLVVVALYAAYPLKQKPLADYNQFRFYGNQGLCFSPAARVALLERMKGAKTLEPDDMMVKDYIIYSKCKLMAANPNLVQHVGKSSAIKCRFHKSPTFKGD